MTLRAVALKGALFGVCLQLTAYSLQLSAGELPSLFRGVVVADSPLGVRVVSVAAASQAALGDLRPEDLIIRINDVEVHTIDEFAALSTRLKGRARTAAVLIFRNGAPRELALHLYSYPLLQAWGIEFVPEHDLRFADPQVGREYWARLGRGFEQADKEPEALNAYLNGLHNTAGDVELALRAATLSSQIGQQHLRAGARAEGIAALARSLTMMPHLFDHPLTEAQLTELRDQLRGTLVALRESRRRHVSP